MVSVNLWMQLGKSTVLVLDLRGTLAQHEE